MKILLVSLTKGVKIGAREIQTARLVKALREEGNEVVPLKINNPLIDSSDGYRLNPYKSPSWLILLIRLLLPLPFPFRSVFSELEKIIIYEKPDIILTSSNPLESHIVGLMISKKFGLKWATYFSDPRPISRLPKPYGGSRKIKVNTFYELRLLKRVFQQCDAVIMPSKYGIEHMESSVRVGISHKSYPIPHFGFSESLNIKRSNYIVHSGKLVSKRSSENLLIALKRYKDSGYKGISRLLCVGQVSDEFKTLVSKHNLENFVHYEGNVSLKESERLLKKAKIILVIEANMNFSPFLPSKFCEAVSLDRPILAVSPQKSAISDYLQDQNTKGFSVRDSDIEILEALTEMDSIEYPFTATQLFSHSRIAKMYVDVFKRMLN